MGLPDRPSMRLLHRGTEAQDEAQECDDSVGNRDNRWAAKISDHEPPQAHASSTLQTRPSRAVERESQVPHTLSGVQGRGGGSERTEVHEPGLAGHECCGAKKTRCRRSHVPDLRAGPSRPKGRAGPIRPGQPACSRIAATTNAKTYQPKSVGGKLPSAKCWLGASKNVTACELPRPPERTRRRWWQILPSVFAQIHSGQVRLLE